MTKAAKSFGKDLSHFMRSPATTEYVEALSANFADKELIEVKRGSGLLPDVGTWGHPKLAVFFARWLSPAFAVFCDAVIDDILNKKASLTIDKPDESFAMQVPQSLPEALRMAADLAGKNEGLHKSDVVVKRVNCGDSHN